MRKKTAWLALLLAAFAMTASAQVDVEPYVRKDAFQTIEISPDGRYLAATVPKEDRTGVVILQRGDLKVTASFALGRSEEHTSELQSLMRISYAVFCLKKKKNNTTHNSRYYL